MLTDSERPYEDEATWLALNAWFDGEADTHACAQVLGLLEANPDLADALRVMRDTRITMLEIGELEPPRHLTESILAAVRPGTADEPLAPVVSKSLAHVGIPVACAALLLLLLVLRTAAPRRAILGMLATSSLIGDSAQAPAGPVHVAQEPITQPVVGPFLFQPAAARVGAASQLASNALAAASRIALNLVSTPAPRNAVSRPVPAPARSARMPHTLDGAFPPQFDMSPAQPALSLASAESDASADFMAKSDTERFKERLSEPAASKGIEQPVRAVTAAATPPPSAHASQSPPVVHHGRLMLSELPPASHFNGMDVKQQIAAMNMGYSRETLENIKRHVAAISIIDSTF